MKKILSFFVFNAALLCYAEQAEQAEDFADYALIRFELDENVAASCIYSECGTPLDYLWKSYEEASGDEKLGIAKTIKQAVNYLTPNKKD